jgi:phosphatidylserine/phosphatidylglycerophosphate/cardiolipin synthase-like enzyme
VKRIGEAKTNISLEVYMLSEKRIIEALKDAKSRGIEVKVILEPNPFGNSYINKRPYTTLQNANIPVVWADSKKYVFTPAKFFLIDDSYIVMTANMTHSAFVTNREFYME